MSKLHDDLINEIEPGETVEESMDSFARAIADRIEGCNGNRVKLSDLCTILREDTPALGRALVANTPAANAGQKTRSTSYDAPSPAFEKPRSDVQPGMTDTNDHRDQVTPPNENTEAQREQIKVEQTAAAQGKPVVVEQLMPAPATQPAQQPVTFKDDKAKAPA